MTRRSCHFPKIIKLSYKPRPSGRPFFGRIIFPPYIGSLVIASKIRNPQMTLATAENLLTLS